MNQNIIRKIYSWISGISLILINLVTLIIGYLSYISSMALSLVESQLNQGTLLYPFYCLLITFIVVADVAGIIRGVYLIKDTIKPSNQNEYVYLTYDVLMILFNVLGILFVLGGQGLVAIIMLAVILLAIIDLVLVKRDIKKQTHVPDRSIKNWKILFACALIMVPVLVLSSANVVYKQINQNLNRIQIGDVSNNTFSSFNATDLNGNEYDETMFKGHKVTMINVWGTDCSPCIREMPDLQSILDETDPSDLQIVGLLSDAYRSGQLNEDALNTARGIVETIGVRYPILIPSKELQNGAISGVIQVTPTTIFFDEEGRQIRTEVGAKNKNDWEKIINEVIGSEK